VFAKCIRSTGSFGSGATADVSVSWDSDRSRYDEDPLLSPTVLEVDAGEPCIVLLSPPEDTLVVVESCDISPGLCRWDLLRTGLSYVGYAGRRGVSGLGCGFACGARLAVELEEAVDSSTLRCSEVTVALAFAG